jgi:NADH:ubiquinone oxidoreductase subunit C
MTDETTIQRELTAKFPFLQDKIKLVRARRLTVQVPVLNLPEVFDHLVRQMDFTILCTITGLDLGATLGVIYHLAQPVSGVVLNLSTEVHKLAPIVKSVTPYFSSAEVYEREMVDLLGIEVRGLPPGSRYPLPDDWPKEVYPLRKDWNLSMLLKKEASRAKP